MFLLTNASVSFDSSGEFVDDDLDLDGGGDNNGRNGRRGRRGGVGGGALAGGANRGRMVDRVAQRVVRMFMNDDEVSNDGSMDIDNDDDDVDDDDTDNSDASSDASGGDDVDSPASNSRDSNDGWETTEEL